MRQILATAFGLYFIVFFFSSCAVTKQQSYFETLKKDTTISGMVTPDFETKIQPGDILNIKVSSLSSAEDMFFNSAASETASGDATSASKTVYLVSSEGTIHFHKLGQINVVGQTIKQLKAKLEQALTPYLKDGIVNVNYANHKVTFIGDIAQPGILNIPDEKLSIIDAIAMRGDMKPEAQKSQVMLIREENNQKHVRMLNLQDHSIFTSPYYYLKANDIVYITTDQQNRMREERRRNLQSTLALVASGVSLIVIVIDRILR